MQGAIFNAFADMITEQMGMQQWNALLDATRPPSQGIYTRGEQYDDSELSNMLLVLCDKTGLPIEQLLENFGLYLFDKLYVNSPADLSSVSNLSDFLLAIDSVIHVEVKRLHPDAYLPKFEYEKSADNTLIMYYSSKRKLCYVSIGLIQGAAKQFKQQVEIAHLECMHHGAERCKFKITFK